MPDIASPVFRILTRLAVTLCGFLAVVPVHAQTLEGDWFFQGFYVEVEGGLSKQADQNFESGTFNFVRTGGDNYRLSVVDRSGTDAFDMELTKKGNTFSGIIPTDEETGSTTKEEVRITVDGDFAYLASLTWSVSTEPGLVGQSFRYETAGYMLSRNQFPTQVGSRWSGNYAYRLVGQTQVWGQEDRIEAVDVVSLILDADAGGGTATYQGSNYSTTYNMLPDALGLGGAITIPLDGTVVDNPGFTVNRDEVRRYAMAVQINESEMGWLQTSVLSGSVNTGTNDEYFLLTAASTLVGRATRTVESLPEFTRNLPTEVAVVAGGDVFLSVDAVGAPAPQYRWYMSDSPDAPALNLISANDPRFEFDSINDTPWSSTPHLVLRNVTAEMDGLTFEIEASNSVGSTQSVPARLKVLSAPTTRLPNLSVRTSLEANQELIVGFVMNGGSKPLLVRAIGPSLGSLYDVPDVMPDPQIGFNNASGVQISANDDWDAALSTTFAELGAFALEDGAKDAALQVDLSGIGTVSVSGPEAGAVLVEVYDIGNNNDVRLANVSARNHVGTGDNIMIAGFVVKGEDPKNMLIRAVGPGLAAYDITDFLVDPQLKIFRQEANNPILVAENDNWSPGLKSSFTLTGAFPLTDLSLDAGVVVTLSPGAYTAQVSGADGGTGQAIVEIYELP